VAPAIVIAETQIILSAAPLTVIEDWHWVDKVFNFRLRLSHCLWITIRQSLCLIKRVNFMAPAGGLRTQSSASLGPRHLTTLAIGKVATEVFFCASALLGRPRPLVSCRSGLLATTGCSWVGGLLVFWPGEAAQTAFILLAELIVGT